MRINVTVAVIFFFIFTTISLGFAEENSPTAENSYINSDVAYAEQQKELRAWLNEIKPAAGVIQEDSSKKVNYWEQRVVRKRRRATTPQ